MLPAIPAGKAVNSDGIEPGLRAPVGNDVMLAATSLLRRAYAMYRPSPVFCTTTPPVAPAAVKSPFNANAEPAAAPTAALNVPACGPRLNTARAPSGACLLYTSDAA